MICLYPEHSASFSPCCEGPLPRWGFGETGAFWVSRALLGGQSPEERGAVCVLASHRGSSPHPIPLPPVSGFHLPATFPKTS